MTSRGLKFFRNTASAQLSPDAHAAIFAALMIVAGQASAQILKNGSFENPSIADGTRASVVPSFWAGGALIMNPNAGGGMTGEPAIWPQAADGEQYEDIANTAAFALSQSFTIVDAGVYRLQWRDNTALNLPPGSQTAPYSVSLADLSSNLIYSQSFDSYHADGSWGTISTQQPLASGSYTLTFTSLNIAHHTDTVIDAVSVTAVPEPSVSGMFTIGLTMVVVLALNRRRIAGGA